MDNKNTKMSGISMCNPVDIDAEYLEYTLDYSIKHGFNHFQIIGPIHNPIKGNIDGMIKLRKYSQFNYEKNQEYVDFNLEVVNRVTKKASENGIRSYMWHHELDLPTDFGKEFPQILNAYGDIEVSHPLVIDFLENKISDFFAEYPYMDGIILTLHETKVPLLKLKDQKLGKVERVKLVTKTIYDTCTKLGKELIVRPFASIEEDYAMMTKAYSEISEKLVIMDKWTQFDWSLTLPNNRFFAKIEKNPIFVEADIFGEYFGKGRLPIMLEDHIAEKIAHCNGFSPIGYVSRIDRAGEHPFGSVNEVNLVIMNAHIKGKDPKSEIMRFFGEKYGINAAPKIYSVMSRTEEVQKKMFYLNGYYFHSQSYFPSFNHSNNHFYFEIMRTDCSIASDEWFIPPGWNRTSVDDLAKEKEEAVTLSRSLLSKVEGMKDILSPENYNELRVKFDNLYTTAMLWQCLFETFRAYSEFFEDKCDESRIHSALDKLLQIDQNGKERLGKDYAITCGWALTEMHNIGINDRVVNFVSDIKKLLAVEKKSREALKACSYYDYIVCGGATESHKLKKEVNFSDIYILPQGVCRIPGTSRGSDFSRVNAHGWFSYELKVHPNTENKIIVNLGSLAKKLDIKISFADQEIIIQEEIADNKIIEFTYNEKNGSDSVRIRFDRISPNTPCVYSVAVQ